MTQTSDPAFKIHLNFSQKWTSKWPRKSKYLFKVVLIFKTTRLKWYFQTKRFPKFSTFGGKNTKVSKIDPNDRTPPYGIFSVFGDGAGGQPSGGPIFKQHCVTMSHPKIYLWAKFGPNRLKNDKVMAFLVFLEGRRKWRRRAAFWWADFQTKCDLQ